MSEQAKDSVFLLGGARFKLSFQDIYCEECGAEHDKVTVEPLGMYASDLQGKWVALVPAENDAHLYLEELKQQRDELLAALKPFANMAKHFPQTPKYGNRPYTGEIMSMNPGGDDEASITVEDLHAAKAAIEKAK